MLSKIKYLSSIGKYSLIVWFTSSILRIIVQWVYGIYSLSRIIPVPSSEIIYIFRDWILEGVPYLLKETLFGFPIFYLLCWLLNKFSRTSIRFKIMLSICVLFYSIYIYDNIEPNKFVSWIEQFISQFMIYCGTLLVCIWLFQIRDDRKFVNNDDILDT